jgi:hypothetical protein
MGDTWDATHKVKYIKEKRTQKGAPYLGVQFGDSSWASCFDTKLHPAIWNAHDVPSIGATFRFETSGDDNQFTNIIDVMHPETGASLRASAPAKAAEEPYNGPSDRPANGGTSRAARPPAQHGGDQRASAQKSASSAKSEGISLSTVMMLVRALIFAGACAWKYPGVNLRDLITLGEEYALRGTKPMTEEPKSDAS